MYIPGTISRGDKIESINLAGVDPDTEQRFTALSKKKIRGEFLHAGEHSIYLSRSMGERLDAGPGR